MKAISEKTALERLARLRASFAETVRSYEQKARACSTCLTPGVCCVDAHFVNVRISRLEARAIAASIEELDPEAAEKVWDRVERTVTDFGLDLAAGGSKTFACPLFEKGTGCLVHHTAKPVPCVLHACYNDAADLPPQELQDEQEAKIARLNKQTYGFIGENLPLPLAVKKAANRQGSQPSDLAGQSLPTFRSTSD